MIKTKGEVVLVEKSDGSWNIQYRRKWLPTLYWLTFFREWTYFAPDYHKNTLLCEGERAEKFQDALDSLNRKNFGKGGLAETIVCREEV